MDYTLATLKDAFTDAAYKESRRGYKLYAVLLATTLDQRFLAEYLSLFYELHALTGEDVLVVGVKPGGQRRDGDEAPPVHIIDLKSVAATLRHDDRDRSSEDARARETAEHFLQFLQAQTAESYALARFLGVRTDQFPAMVFFEDLERPSEMVVWPLADMRATEFARRLRHLVEEVRERCAWRAADSIPSLKHVVELLRRAEPLRFDYSVPADLREAAKAVSRLRDDLKFYEHALRVHEKIDALRVAFDELRATPGLRVPLENVGKTIDLLATGDVEHRGFGHVIAHEKRWRGRLPASYGAVVGALDAELPYYGVTKPLPPRDEVASKVATLRVQLAATQEGYAHRLQSERDQRVLELEDVQSRQHTAPRVLAVIHDLLHIRPQAIETGGSPRDAFRTMRHGAAPRVFISYSHDSPSHEAAVLELAQRLRGDGIDCWIDQFESSPAAGFPRWMQQQIRLADTVLLICTATYRRRFDGAELAGKGLGATFEGHLILQEVYDAGSRNDRYIPVLLPGATPHDVPAVVRGSKWYEVPQGYDALRRRLLGSGAVEPHPLGFPFDQ